MKTVVDTNVIVSALLNPYGHAAKIVRLLLAGHINICYDQRILSEYKEVLNRPKFDFNKEHIDAFLDEIKYTGHQVLSTPLKKSLPDPNDNMFLEVAIAGNVEYIITGNLNHFPKQLCQGVQVYSLAGFMKNYSKIK